MPADMEVKIGADTTQYESATTRMLGAHENVNKLLRDQGGLTNAVTHGLERSVFKAVAIVHVFKEISQAIEESKKKLIEFNDKLGDQRMKDIGNIIGLVGPSGASGMQAMMEGAPGAATSDQMSGFAASMATANQSLMDKHKSKMSQRTINTLSRAYLRGGESVFPGGGKQLIKMAESGEAGLDDRIGAYVSGQFNLPAGTHDPIGAALETLPGNIKTKIQQDSEIKSEQYRKTMAEDAGGAGARAKRVSDSIAKIKENSMFANVVDTFFGSAINPFGLIYRPFRDIEMQTVLDRRDYADWQDDQRRFLNRKVINNDANNQGTP